MQMIQTNLQWCLWMDDAAGQLSYQQTAIES